MSSSHHKVTELRRDEMDYAAENKENIVAKVQKFIEDGCGCQKVFSVLINLQWKPF